MNRDEVRCRFCKRYVKKLNDNGRCEGCDKEYQDVVTGIMKRYDDAFKKLAQR